jgi:hypothetical protein
MKIKNLKSHYMKCGVITFGFCSFLAVVFYIGLNSLLPDQGATFSDVRFNTKVAGVFAFCLFYINQKFYFPHYFYKKLECPRCTQTYFTSSNVGTSIRMDILNESPCKSCGHQFQFEI